MIVRGVGGFMADALTADPAPCPSPRWVPAGKAVVRVCGG
jgi:hypothetical protein